jgi:hypothetical protein
LSRPFFASCFPASHAVKLAPHAKLPESGGFTFVNYTAYYRLDLKNEIQLGFICTIVKIRLFFKVVHTKGIRMNLYVGNLSWEVTDDSLRTFFGRYGEVTAARVITDRETGRSRGFGFVEMPDDAARNAIAQGEGLELEGRPIRISEARPSENRSEKRSENRTRR